MSITELRDKYQKEVYSVRAWGMGNCPDWDIGTMKYLKHQESIYKQIVDDLNALIQSEDKERRELLERFWEKCFTNYPANFKEFVINYFLESENK